MLPSEKTRLNQNLFKLSKAIDDQMAVLVNRAREMDIENPMDMMNTDGSFSFVPLLSAQAQILSAQVYLNKE